MARCARSCCPRPQVWSTSCPPQPWPGLFPLQRCGSRPGSGVSLCLCLPAGWDFRRHAPGCCSSRDCPTRRNSPGVASVRWIWGWAGSWRWPACTGPAAACCSPMPWWPSAPIHPPCSMPTPRPCCSMPASGAISPWRTRRSSAAAAGSGWCCLPPTCGRLPWRCRAGERCWPRRWLPACASGGLTSGCTPSAGSPTGRRPSRSWCPATSPACRWRRCWKGWCFPAAVAPWWTGSAGWRSCRSCVG